MQKILIIEEEERVATIVKRDLEEHNYQVTVARNGISGKHLALSHDFDLIITDIILPQIDGLGLCKEIRARKLAIPIIMLSALGTTDDKIESFEAGADDYLVKPFELRELHVRIRALLKRKTGNTNAYHALLKYADLEFNLHTKIVKRNTREISLTPKEMKLLQYLMENPERVLSRIEIAENVWDISFDSGTNFIDVYIYYLRKKIDKNFDIKLIRTKPGLGFVFKQD